MKISIKDKKRRKHLFSAVQQLYREGEHWYAIRKTLNKNEAKEVLEEFRKRNYDLPFDFIQAD